VTIIVLVVVGVILVIMAIILFTVLAGKPKAVNPTNPLLRQSQQLKSALPEPHVIRVAVDWPPVPPPQIKMELDRMQGRGRASRPYAV
jgi:hypothetical protein